MVRRKYQFFSLQLLAELPEDENETDPKIRKQKLKDINSRRKTANVILKEAVKELKELKHQSGESK
jgi:hypothetical protein